MENKKIFVGEDGGRNIRVIDIRDNYTSSLIKGNSRTMIDNILRKIDKNTDNTSTVVGYRLYKSASSQPMVVDQAIITGEIVTAIRSRQFAKIQVLLKGGKSH